MPKHTDLSPELKDAMRHLQSTPRDPNYIAPPEQPDYFGLRLAIEGLKKPGTFKDTPEVRAAWYRLMGLSSLRDRRPRESGAAYMKRLLHPPSRATMLAAQKAMAVIEAARVGS